MSKQDWHVVDRTETYVQVVLPLLLAKAYTYYVPEEWLSMVQFGVRVEVQFGKNRHYTGLVVDITREPPEEYQAKPILAVIDENPILRAEQVRFWQWLADYYCCSIGEVMNAALPANLKLNSETQITLSPLFDGNMGGLGDSEFLVTEALTMQETLTMEAVRQILNRKTVYPVIRRLLDKKIIYLQEDLQERYRPKRVRCVRWQPPYADEPETQASAFDLAARSARQTEVLLALIQLERQQPFVTQSALLKKAGASHAVLNALEKKGILERYDREISRLGGYEEETIEAGELSALQQNALAELRAQLAEREVVLLHGVTGSGKTRLYLTMIQEALDRGEQALYLVPEIALTSQLTERLQKFFGDQLAVYHSRLGDQERVELWHAILQGKRNLAVGARSALFLPFRRLRLVVVDEEHDSSYKQQDPAPRYHARDAAIYYARQWGAKTLLGTATPSLESYFNVRRGKYGLVEMKERYGGLQLPEIQVIDAKKALQKNEWQSHFTKELIEAMRATLDRGEQVILFQNRRGFAPTYRCNNCDWQAACVNCDVSLTYHRQHQALKCHYCGYQRSVPVECPACGQQALMIVGFGTQRIEEELKIYLPEAKIGRLDFDSVKGKRGHSKIIHEFETGHIEVLVGTQMITKGLDFERVGLVGVLSADHILHFPDFRSTERGFQLMTQVAGRAGRKHRRGLVLIQAFHVGHPVLKDVLDGDFQRFFRRELHERQAFGYPPYFRIIRVQLRHKQAERVNQAGRLYDKFIRPALGDRITGPGIPPVGRVRGYFLLDFLVKLEKNAQAIHRAKEILADAAAKLKRQEGLSTVRIVIDVDPVN